LFCGWGENSTGDFLVMSFDSGNGVGELDACGFFFSCEYAALLAFFFFSFMNFYSGLLYSCLFERDYSYLWNLGRPFFFPSRLVWGCTMIRQFFLQSVGLIYRVCSVGGS